ncbi:MAG: hypothetical protein WCP52_01355 [Bacteroidota bacterium]
MKRKVFAILNILALVYIMPIIGYSQNIEYNMLLKLDTLVSIKNTFILGKITKISETEVEYKKVNEIDAPVYVLGKNKLKEIRWANGTVEKIVLDEFDVNKEEAIIDKRSALKFNFFSLVNDQITFTYEHSIKVGFNANIAVGLINNSMLKYSVNSSANLTQGYLVRAGLKYLLGTDYYVKGMKYTHPLKGRFIMPELAYSRFTVRGIRSTYYTQTISNGPYYNYTYTYNYIYSDRIINALSITINYGRQFILGNVITCGYSIGVGYSFYNSKYTNPDILKSSSGYYYNSEDLKKAPSDLYTHFRDSNIPVAITGSITLGYIFK